MRTKQSLYAAIALSVGFSSAQAVYLNPRGTGQVLVYPYYTVNANQSTLLSIVNTTPNGKALRVAFHEGYNGRLVLGFNLYLSPYDVWSAEIAADGSGVDAPARIETADNSCTVPAFISADFRSASYVDANADTGPQSPGRTREGHFDVIEMGEVTNAAHGTLSAITHDVNGVPANCVQVVEAWATGGYWAADPTTDLAPPGGGLYGSEFIIDVARGTFYAANAEAIDSFSAKIQHTLPTDTGPDLNSANDAADGAGATALVPVGGKLLQVNYTNPVDAVSALFMADTLYNEYDVDPTLGAASDWVVTFPTKRFYVDPQLLGSPPQVVPPFDELFGESVAGESCVPFVPWIFNREEQTFAYCGEQCPLPQSYAMCFETSVLPVDADNSVLGSALFAGDEGKIQGPYGGGTAFPFVNGHVALLLGGISNHTLTSFTNGDRFIGVPAFGFLARNYINANVTQGVLANYSSVQPHKTRATCMVANTNSPDCQ